MAILLPEYPLSSRPSGRAPNQLRDIQFQRHYTCHAEGSVLVSFGDTRVLCTASVEERTPPWLRDAGQGWLTAEYGMLPRATNTRNRREASAGKQSGRTQEIQRLIGRSLRSVINMQAIDGLTITIDCDVLQADGGTRTAAISGGYVALVDAMRKLQAKGTLKTDPIHGQVAAISVGVFEGTPVLDLDYPEDSAAETDMNVVMNEASACIEVQGTAEAQAFSRDELNAMLDLAEKGIGEILQLQRDALNETA